MASPFIAEAEPSGLWLVPVAIAALGLLLGLALVVAIGAVDH